MSGKNHHLNPLAARKQLLITESDLNRAQLVQDWQAVADGVHSVASRARTLGSMVSATASLVAILASFRRQQTAPAAEKPSWLPTLLKGTALISTVWQAFRPRDRNQDGI
jgi:hypothetical protein